MEEEQEDVIGTDEDDDNVNELDEDAAGGEDLAGGDDLGGDEDLGEESSSI